MLIKFIKPFGNKLPGMQGRFENDLACKLVRDGFAIETSAKKPQVKDLKQEHLDKTDSKEDAPKPKAKEKKTYTTKVIKANG